MATAEQEEEARVWLREHGWDVVVEERDLREDLIRADLAGLATYNHTHWVDLVSLRNPRRVVSNYSSGKTRADAVVSAKRRYGSEQT